MSVSVSCSDNGGERIDWNCLEKRKGYRRSGNYDYCEPERLERILNADTKRRTETILKSSRIEGGRRRGRTMKNSGFQHLFSNFIVGFLFYGILLLAIWSWYF